MDPRSKKDFVADFDYEFDEKHKTVAVTEHGVAKAEKFLGIDHLYRAENGHLVNHLIQSLKAESLYKRDVDYAVVDGEVKIIDEFTGRILDGRRWSEGLHQAVEAKEGVRVQEENQTLATITLQNYFRLYDKLAGMTGTALTEATEFMKIYKLGVVQIPTNRRWSARTRTTRSTRPATASGTPSRARSRSATPRASRCSSARSPSRSPSCSASSSRSGASRTPSSTPSPSTPSARARSSPRPAGPARSRSPPTWPAAASTSSSAATPSTSPSCELAKLGLKPRDPDYEERFDEILPKIEEQVEEDRERVMEAGGLFICGTERHESRRIDNQLRGRSGRQGDPGESRFFLSAEDDLVRLFAGDRIYKILDRLGAVDDEGDEEPIEAEMLTKQIEKAQRKVEEQNFLIRKRVLEYDDVMNEQRQIVYAYRDDVLEGKDMGERRARRSAASSSGSSTSTRPATTSRTGTSTGCSIALDEIFPGDALPEDFDARAAATESSDREGLAEQLDRAGASRSTTSARRSSATSSCARSSATCCCRSSTTRWREHLYDMDYLREGIHLRGFAQIEPIVAYKNEAFDALHRPDELASGRDFARDGLQRRGRGRGRRPRRRAAGVRRARHRRPAPGNVSYSGGSGALQGAGAIAAAAGGRSRVRAPSTASPSPRQHAGFQPVEQRARRRARADRPQRPVLVRVGQEVQEVPRRVIRGSRGA